MKHRKRDKAQESRGDVEKDVKVEVNVEDAVAVDVTQDDVVGKQAQELVETRNRLLRVTADFQNFKKRMEKERADWSVVSQSVVLRGFLVLIDDIDLAMVAAEASETSKADNEWLEGFRLIQKKFGKILKDLGVEESDCTGIFNPNFHEALISVESDKVESGHVVEVLRKGYSFKDTVLRHARVSVSK